jgi:prepilin-type N-terminal cleavage/methylation domain-containing protein
MQARRLGRSGLPRRRDDAGLTLSEMIVVIALLGMVLAMAQGALILTQRQVTDNTARLDQGQQAKVAMEAMSRNLRTAILPKQLSGTCVGCDIAAFIKGDVRSVQFYANIDNDFGAPVVGLTTRGPSRVSYQVDSAGRLTETVQRPLPHAADDYNYTYCTVGSPGCQITTRVIARNVSTTQTLFTYYANNGDVIPVPLDSSTTRLKAVDSIDVVLTVKSSPRVVGSTVTTRVSLPNADALQAPPTESP